MPIMITTRMAIMMMMMIMKSDPFTYHWQVKGAVGKRVVGKRGYTHQNNHSHHHHEIVKWSLCLPATVMAGPFVSPNQMIIGSFSANLLDISVAPCTRSSTLVSFFLEEEKQVNSCCDISVCFYQSPPKLSSFSGSVPLCCFSLNL